MALARRATALLGAAAIFLTGLCPPALSCGPFLETAIFNCVTNPDLPLKNFAAGDLGIIQSSYARSYLVVAYRYLVDKKLDDVEKTGALALWRARMNTYSDEALNKSIESWLKLRGTVAGVSKLETIRAYRAVRQDADNSFDNYLNCNSDSFDNAAKTLQRLIVKYGAGSVQVKAWLKAQDEVFCHCSGPDFNWQSKKWGKEPPMPAPYVGDDPIMKADRAYQIAAAYFYSQKFDDAAKSFIAIAADASSPYHNLAPYLAVRALLRKCTLMVTPDQAGLQEVKTKLKDIVADKNLASVHDSAQSLIGFVDCRLQPAQRERDLAGALIDRAAGKNFRANLGDYTKILDNYIGDGDDTGDGDRPPATAFDKFPAAILEDDLTDWVCTFGNKGEAAHKRALQNWTRTNGVQWLVAAASTAQKADADAKLLDACAKVPPSSPAYLTLSYHLIRLQFAKGNENAANQRLTEVLTKRDSMPPSSLNLFLDQRLTSLSSFEQFLKAGIRPPSATAFDAGLPENYDAITGKGTGFYPAKPLFSDEAAAFYNNKLPVSYFIQAAQSKLIPANLRRDVVQSAWLRAFMLDGALAVKDLTPLFKTAEPSAAPLLNAFDAAKGDGPKAFAAAFMVLKFPGFRPFVTAGVQRTTPIAKIDDYQDNWWCVGRIKEYDDAQPGKNAPVIEAKFLSAAQKAAAAAELKRLNALGPAANYLCNNVLAYARSNARDSRVPEALALAVRCTKLGCKDDKTSKLSAECWKLLHKNYPNDAWAKKTKYYY